MKILVTGAEGFIGKNLVIGLKEIGIGCATFCRGDTLADLRAKLKEADFIVHLAGENRPKDSLDYDENNAKLTENICHEIRKLNINPSIIFASSTQALLNNPYGISKRRAEIAIENLSKDIGNLSYIFRLPGTFGKWSRPNYNSVVATFCHNIIRDLPIQVSNPDNEIELVYIDDVVKTFIDIIHDAPNIKNDLSIKPSYKITLGELAETLKRFRKNRSSLFVQAVNDGLLRKLYATYQSYHDPDNFSYFIPSYIDERGNFAEILKTQANGQFSYFTAGPGVTRGGHYHHSKCEKFLVVKGKAKFRFKSLLDGTLKQIYTSGERLEIVETVPGWIHDITNVGSDEMIVFLWANEIFDREAPDTFISEIDVF